MTALTMWQLVSSQRHEISSYYMLALFVLRTRGRGWQSCPRSHYLWIAVLTVWPYCEAVCSLTSMCVFRKPWMKAGLHPGLIYFRVCALSNLTSHNTLFTLIYRICPAPFFTLTLQEPLRWGKGVRRSQSNRDTLEAMLGTWSPP